MNDKSRTTGIRRALSLLDAGIARFEAAVLSGGVMAMALVTIANVTGRNVFGHSLAFADEVNQALLVLITFIGIGYAARRARHIRMSALYDQLGGRPRKVLIVLVSVGTALLLSALTWFAAQYAWQVHQLGGVTPALRIPLYLIYAWVPVGLALGAVQYVLAAWRNLVSTDTWLSYSERDEYKSVGESGASGAL